MFIDYTDLLGSKGYSLPNRLTFFSTGSASDMLLAGNLDGQNKGHDRFTQPQGARHRDVGA